MVLHQRAALWMTAAERLSREENGWPGGFDVLAAWLDLRAMRPLKMEKGFGAIRISTSRVVNPITVSAVTVA